MESNARAISEEGISEMLTATPKRRFNAPPLALLGKSKKGFRRRWNSKAKYSLFDMKYQMLIGKKTENYSTKNL